MLGTPVVEEEVREPLLQIISTILLDGIFEGLHRPLDLNVVQSLKMIMHTATKHEKAHQSSAR